MRFPANYDTRPRAERDAEYPKALQALRLELKVSDEAMTTALQSWIHDLECGGELLCEWFHRRECQCQNHE